MHVSIHCVSVDILTYERLVLKLWGMQHPHASGSRERTYRVDLGALKGRPADDSRRHDERRSCPAVRLLADDESICGQAKQSVYQQKVFTGGLLHLIVLQVRRSPFRDNTSEAASDPTTKLCAPGQQPRDRSRANPHKAYRKSRRAYPYALSVEIDDHKTRCVRARGRRASCEPCAQRKWRVAMQTRLVVLNIPYHNKTLLSSWSLMLIICLLDTVSTPASCRGRCLCLGT